MIKITKIGIFATLLAISVSGCGTTKKVTEKHKEYYTESSQEESHEQVGVGERLDRTTVMGWFSEWAAMWQSQTLQQDTEEIRETVTTTTDSAGTVTRVESRTTNRASATQNSQSALEYGKEFQMRIDSLSMEIEALQQKVATLSDSRDYGYTETREEKKALPMWFQILCVVWLLMTIALLANFVHKKIRSHNNS